MTTRPSRPSTGKTQKSAHRWWIAGGAVIVVVLLAWLLWPHPAAAPAPRARQYQTFTACLLTNGQGLTDPTAAPAWAGLQDASLATRAKVEYLAVAGPLELDNATTYVNTLGQRKCNIIVAGGGVLNEAANQAASRYPDTAFYLLGAAPTTPANNVTVIAENTPTQTRTRIAQLVTAAAHS